MMNISFSLLKFCLLLIFRVACTRGSRIHNNFGFLFFNFVIKDLWLVLFVSQLSALCLFLLRDFKIVHGDVGWLFGCATRSQFNVRIINSFFLRVFETDKRVLFSSQISIVHIITIKQIFENNGALQYYIKFITNYNPILIHLWSHFNQIINCFFNFNIFIIELLLYNFGAFMSSSDQDIEIVDENQFSTYLASKQAKKQLPNLQKVDDIAEECWKIHKRLVDLKKEQIAMQIVKLINQNFQKSNKSQISKNQNDTGERGEVSNLIKPQKLIMPVCIRKSQTQYLPQFITALFEKIKEIFQTNNDQDDSSNEDRRHKNKHKKHQKQMQKKRKQLLTLNNSRKINIFFNQQKQVCKIALYIHQRLKLIHLPPDMTLYLTDAVVNLSPENLYIFQQGLADCNCLIIAPTYQNFQQVSYNKFSSMEIIPIKLFEHKELFCQFMYECICSPQIKAYLPKESLKLIDDFDDFPITYIQGSRRLIHCIKRLYILKQRRKINFKQVDIKTMFEVIEKSLKKIFIIFHLDHSTLKKYIKCILDQDQPFNLLDRYLTKANYFLKHQQQSLTEIDLLVKLRQKLIGYIEKQDNIKQYVRFFKEPLQKAKKGKAKSKQMVRFGVSEEHYMDQKNILQKQIKLAITSIANQIRKQARNFKWQQFYFVQEIKPMLPYHIMKGVKKSPIHHQIIEFIYTKISTPLVRVIHHFCEQEQQMNYGQLMYYMKDLQMHGLIDISQNALNPIVTPAYFDKSTFNARQMG